jgi:hypothetical protein
MVAELVVGKGGVIDFKGIIVFSSEIKSLKLKQFIRHALFNRCINSICQNF